MKKFTALHLSDLHLSATHEHDQQVVLKSLFFDISKQVEEGKKIDAVFFTGDLIAKGDYKNTPAYYVKQRFFEPLVKAANISNDRLYIVPGNHDVETKKADVFAEAGFNSIFSYQQVNDIIDNLASRPYLANTSASFNASLASYALSNPIFENSLFRSYTFQVDQLNIGIACLNSSWRASGKAQDYDYGKLLVGERQVELLAQSVIDGSPC